MASTTVNGNLKDAGYNNYASQVLYFRLKNAGTDASATSVVARNTVSATTDASGDFSISLWCNGLSDIESVYEVQMPGGERKEFIIPSASAGGSIEFDRLLALHQPSGNLQVIALGDVFLEEANNLSDLASAATARTNLGVAIGTDVQAWDTHLDDIAALTPTDGNIIVGDGTNWVSESGATARTSLGVAIGTDVQAVLTEGAFVDGDKSKLDGIEAGADVTDTANVTSAGALMDSEVTNLAAVKAFDPTDYATAAQGSSADTALQPSDINTFAALDALVADQSLLNVALGNAAYEPLGVSAADITDATATGQAAITAANASALRNAAGATAGVFPAAALDLSALNGSNITSGTVADARIADTITRDTELTATANRRAFAGGVDLDTTAAARVNKPAPTGAHTIYLRVEFDTLTEFFGTNTASTYTLGTMEYRFYFSAGDLIIRLYDSTNFNQATYSSSASITTGKPVTLSIHNPADGTAPTVYVDGTALAAPATSTSGTPPGWDKTLVGNYWAYGQTYDSNAARLDGTIYNAAIFNRALTAAEALALASQGLTTWLASNPEEMWGDATGGTYTSDFSTTDGWSAGTGVTRTANAGKLDVTFSPTGSILFRPGFTGHKFKVKFTISNLVLDGATDLRLYMAQNDGGQTNIISVSANGTYEAIVDLSTEGHREADGLRFDPSGAPTTLLSFTLDSMFITKLGALAAYPMDEGIGRQLRDLSGRYDALLSTTGYQHLQPKTEGYVRVTGIDADPAIYMLEASDIIPADSVITDIIAEERKVAVVNTAQDLADNRIRLNPSGSDLQIQRSDGTNHTTMGTVTAPTSLDDIDAQIHYQQIIR